MPNPPCTICGKVLAGRGKGPLEQHMRVHTGNRPFICELDGCKKSFVQKKDLEVHNRTHNGDRPFKCDVEGCMYASTTSGNLKVHKLIHIGAKPYRCDFEGCHAAYNNSGSLFKHKLAHGEEQFNCDFDSCNASFKRKDHLKVHKQFHVQEKNFNCDFDGCQATFVTAGGLKIHSRVHSGVRPYVCDFEECRASFTTSGSLKIHKQAWHSKEGIQRKKKQEQAMQAALVLGNYVQSFERGRVPPPGQFTREVYFDHRCALARNFMPGEKKYAYVDFVVTTPDGRVVFLEVDEEQHSYQSQLCETTRMWNICESIALADLGGEINVFWLRINPNSGYHVGGRTLKTSRELRFQEVVKFLDNLKSSPPDPPMQIGYAYYDCEANGTPLVLKDPEYYPDVAKTVVCISKGSQKLIQPCEFPPVNPLFAPVNWSQTIEEMQEVPDSEEEEEDVPPGEAGGSSGKRARVR